MWNNIIIEAFCFGDEVDGKYPCGQRHPTAFCLRNGSCPHLAYSESSERMAAYFVPFRLILKDKIAVLLEIIRSWLYCWFWANFWFNRRKTREFFDSIKVTKPGDYPEIDTELERCNAAFPEWFKKAKEEK